MQSSATAQIEHSFSKGLVDLYQRVIADPTNSGVSFFCGFWWLLTVRFQSRLTRSRCWIMIWARLNKFG